MRTVLLHGLGQSADDWAGIASSLAPSTVDCPELFALTQGSISYPQILAGLEQRYADFPELLRLCGLSLGGMLALDYAIRHSSQVESLILIGVQYKVPRLLVDLQDHLFRWMPDKAFEEMGISKSDVIHLTHSMRDLDFTKELGKVQCPVTIVCGQKDLPNRKAARELQWLFPRAKLLIVPGAGHEVNKDAPGAILGLFHSP